MNPNRRGILREAMAIGAAQLGIFEQCVAGLGTSSRSQAVTLSTCRNCSRCGSHREGGKRHMFGFDSALQRPFAVAFVEYGRSPEDRYPVAIEQAYATAQWITRQGSTEGLDRSRLAVAGDSVGGNMTAALAILGKRRGDVTFLHQSLYYPVTDAAQDTDSYREFAEGPFLRARSMAWFWDAYCPDLAKRSEITAAVEQAIAILRKALGTKSSMSAPSGHEVSHVAANPVR